jgi:xylulokinase
VPFLIGVDVGTSGAKVVVIDERGALLRSATSEYPMATPQPGWTEQNPEDWHRAVKECLAQVNAPADAPMGFTGQMHGAVFLDANDHVIRPALLWNDQRTAAQCKTIEEKLGAQRVREITGNAPVTSFQLPKLLWLRKHEPQHARRLTSLLLPKDFIRLRLTGERATDVADASGTGAFDVRKREWSRELCERLDVDPALFPTVGESSAVAGAGDQAAGAVGTGAVREGIVSVSIGTSGVVFAALNEMPAKRDDAVNLFCHATGGWHAMTVMLSAGGALRWFRDTVYGPGASYDTIMNDVASVERAPDDLAFLPYLAGERSPHIDPDVRGAFVGLSLHHTRAHLARAVVEGITFGLRDGFDALSRVTGATPKEVRVTGGGGRSPVWRQLLAGVFGVPVVTLECEEGPAFGAAILAGVRAGVWASVTEACDATVRASGRTEPTARSHEEAFARFRSLYPRLRDPL